jgi:hypothetical protein
MYYSIIAGLTLVRVSVWKKRWNPQEKRDEPTDLPCYFPAPNRPGKVLANLLPTSGVHVYEICQQIWPVGFVKHARCTDFLYFPYLHFVSVCKILA